MIYKKEIEYRGHTHTIVVEISIDEADGIIEHVTTSGQRFPRWSLDDSLKEAIQNKIQSFKAEVDRSIESIQYFDSVLTTLGFTQE